MAQCKLTPREFISNAFSPQIGAVCSSIAESVCQKNNLSFIELLQPFCNLNTEGHFKDPQGTTVTVKSLRLSVQDIHAQPPEPSVARKMLNDSVSSEPCERSTVVRIGNVDLDIPICVPWFESWREMFLSVQFPSDHEFTKHFLACMIVVASGDENPLDKIQQMAAQLHQSIPGKLPKWFNNNALRYYILIHDTTQDDKAKTEAVFTEMKNLYDPNNCFLLQMNSRPPGHPDENTHLPDPWSQFLINHTDFNASSDHSSSPRTPADMGGVGAMPSEVTTEPDKSSNAGTPVAPQNAGLLSPDFADKLSLSSDISEAPSMHVEMGQEAVPVTIHPLSPEGHRSFSLETGGRSLASSTAMRSRMAALTTNNDSSPINANVWADSPNHPVAQHGSRLSTQDLDRLRTLINEFCLKSLLPYVEKQIGLLSDVISNKKGVSRSLFSATKRWFGTSKPGAPGSAPTNAVIYTAESPELQLRRLGDLCFMFGHYTLAYQVYHSAKRDFAADQAWLYYAGALEMAALSAFMQGEMTRKTIEYMDDAILTYSNSCKMPQFATRATLLSAECLKGRNLHGEAAKQLIRMTSEDSDLRSALLLEQAAYCFIHPRMIHKYAFHAVLAGHRFSKSGQRRHSLRCYQQAYQVYRGRGWSSAEDHIHFTIGRQAASLKQVGDAVRAFEKLLNESSRQSGAQQAAFLREFLHTHHLLRQESTTDRSELPVLPLPLVNGNEIRVLLGSLPGSATNDRVPASNVSFDNCNEEEESQWSKLEEAMVSEAQGSAAMVFKPTIILYTNRTNNSVRPIGVLDEPINISIELYNPMKIPIPLTRVKLLWSFTSTDELSASNETTPEEESDQPVDTEILDSVLLHPTSRRRIILSCTPRRTGDLKILGMSYDLSNPPASDQPIVNPTVAVTGKRLFEIKGPRLKNVKEKPGTTMYGTDCRLDINVVDRSPLMRVTFDKISQEMLCGEMQRLEVTLENVGQTPLGNIHVGSTNPRLFCLENDDEKCDATVTKISLPGNSTSLLPGSQHRMPLWIRAPHTKGNHRVDLLFYWENLDAKSVPKYRLCRHTWQLSVLDSIQISAIARRSAVKKANLPSLTLNVRVKNMNQAHDPFMNEISLERVSLESNAWSLIESIVEPANVKIHPQETYGLLLKLVRKTEGESPFTDVSLSRDRSEVDEGVTTFPYINFVQKRRARSQITPEKFVDTQTGNADAISTLALTTRLDATLILRWRAKVTESGTSARHSIGQHHVDLAVMNKSYKHPEERRTDQNDYTTRLKIFGPDRNVPSSTSVVKAKDEVPESECLKNVVSYSMSHVREGKHNFDRSRMCIIPVSLHLQNHSKSRIDVKIDTIGTSSQTVLPSIKTQLYSPQASTFFRYVGHTAVTCQVDALGMSTIKLQAVIPSPGTYDVSSRLEVSARIANTGEFVSQKWRMESVCSISHSCV